MLIEQFSGLIVDKKSPPPTQADAAIFRRLIKYVDEDHEIGKLSEQVVNAWERLREDQCKLPLALHTWAVTDPQLQLTQTTPRQMRRARSRRRTSTVPVSTADEIALDRGYTLNSQRTRCLFNDSYSPSARLSFVSLDDKLTTFARPQSPVALVGTRHVAGSSLKLA